MKMCPIISNGKQKGYGVFERIECNAPDCMAWVAGKDGKELSEGYCKLLDWWRA